MPDPETPVLHLGLSSDARLNRNWQILDDAIHRIARGVQIADDVSILGSLDVRDDAVIHGSLLAGSISTGVLTASEGIFSGMLTAENGLTVTNGPLILPDGSLDGADFMKGATVQTVGVSAARTAPLSLTTSPQELNRLTLDASEELGRWQIVLAQVSLAIAAGGSTGSQAYLVTLNRGPATVQSRNHSFQLALNTGVEIPLTMVRIAQPGDLSHEWSIWGATFAAPPPTVSCAFAQIHCLQLR